MIVGIIFASFEVSMPSPRIRKMSLSRALDKYLKTVSVHKKGHQQEFYRSNVIKRYPIALRNMDEITTVDIATYRDVRLAEINPERVNPLQVILYVLNSPFCHLCSILLVLNGEPVVLTRLNWFASRKYPRDEIAG